MRGRGGWGEGGGEGGGEGEGGKERVTYSLGTHEVYSKFVEPGISGLNPKPILGTEARSCDPLNVQGRL
jgi:hypothetical protein